MVIKNLVVGGKRFAKTKQRIKKNQGWEKNGFLCEKKAKKTTKTGYNRVWPGL